MLRLVDRVLGEGRLVRPGDPGAARLHVGYELEVYRDWIVDAGDMTPGEWVIEGHLLAAPGLLEPLAAQPGPFLLELGDARRLEVFVLDPHGKVVNVEGTSFIPAR